MELQKQIARNLLDLRENKPLIHSITNLVVMNETANAILSLGALPIMSHAKEEVEEMVGIAGSLVLNIGTLTPDWVDAMELAGKRANALNIPVILDPVGAGATRLRTDSCKRLLGSVKISIVRGNLAEIAALAGVESEVRGVESMGASEDAVSIAGRFAAMHNCTVSITGAVDTVSNGTLTALISNGHPLMGKVVGTGCISSVITASFAAVQQDAYTAAVGGLVAFGIAGEAAAAISGERPGTFHCELYNALYALSAEDIETRSRIQVKNIH